MNDLEDIERVPGPANSDTEIDDASDEETASPPDRYDVSSYGWDSDVEGLVKRLKSDDIRVPRFQRGLVWNVSEKSLFIESLILGLPVPNVFLAQDLNTNKLNIVDGQQRLMSLRDFLEGKFRLTGEKIQKELKGCYFSREVAKAKNSKVLTYRDFRTLSDAVLHSIVIKPDPTQDDPNLGNEYNQAVIQIFHRINTSGTPLRAHEIRTSIFYGSLDNLIRELNEYPAWRELFGERHSRLKDMELILRFIALRANYENYRSPMSEFLDSFMEKNRELSVENLKQIEKAFKKSVTLLKKTLGASGLRSGNTLTVARFDAVMSGFDAYLESCPEPSNVKVADLLETMEQKDDYKWSVEKFVNDTKRVKKRIECARTVFGT